MKKLSLVSLIVGAILFSACNGSSTNTTDTDSTSSMMSTDSGMMGPDSSNRMNNSMSSNSDTSGNSSATISDDTKDFAREAATGGMMEVNLGNVAMKNSATQQVKDFGKMMVGDHTKINNQLKDLAAVKNINLPTMVTSDQQKEIDKLNNETGAQFDKDYVSMMIDDHKKDIDAFKKAADKTNDNDIKSFITNAIPTLQKHLDAIQAIDKKM